MVSGAIIEFCRSPLVDIRGSLSTQRTSCDPTLPLYWLSGHGTVSIPTALSSSFASMFEHFHGLPGRVICRLWNICVARRDTRLLHEAFVYYAVVRQQQCSPIGQARPEPRPQPYRISLGRIGLPGEARQARPKSIAQLIEWLQEEWRRIPVDVLQTLVESMLVRVAAVIAARAPPESRKGRREEHSFGISLAPSEQLKDKRKERYFDIISASRTAQGQGGRTIPGHPTRPALTLFMWCYLEEGAYYLTPGTLAFLVENITNEIRETLKRITNDVNLRTSTFQVENGLTGNGDSLSCIENILFITVAERLARSPPSKANRVQYPTGSQDFGKWESCRTMALVGGFPQGSPLEVHKLEVLFQQDSPVTSSSAIKVHGLEAGSNCNTHSLSSYCCERANRYQSPSHLDTTRDGVFLAGCVTEGIKRLIGNFDTRTCYRAVTVLLAEFIGTGLLVFLSCMANTILEAAPHPTHLQKAIATGMAVAIIIQANDCTKFNVELTSMDVPSTTAGKLHRKQCCYLGKTFSKSCHAPLHERTTCTKSHAMKNYDNEHMQFMPGAEDEHEDSIDDDGYEDGAVEISDEKDGGPFDVPTHFTSASFLQVV
ncbi:hypothetical protein PR048_031638 [Dryococelus australis]|uniref:Uncharacterized protein n=1 Tax=Dryococelus australis TaxID=614101 RepID=A0ABQ9G5U8_9NEOP|nr:hypothetical protein PR048_031638 [Dryococelus australis]